MEEFDRHIKSKIDSLIDVPGVEFNEKRVWRRIKSFGNKRLFFLIGLILLLFSSIIVFHVQNEKQNKIIEYTVSQENTAMTSIDSNNVETNEAFLIENSNMKNVDSTNSFKILLNEGPKDSVDKPIIIKPVKKIIQTRITSPSKLIVNQVKSRKKEINVSLGKESSTIGITHFNKLNHHLLLSYGFQYNKSWYRKFSLDEDVIRPFDIHQIQIPIGLRYNFLRRERRFNPFLYTGLKHSVLFHSETKAIDFNMNFEAELGLDYRIFSTADGKKGYLRFKLPLYNKDIINQGVYRPSLYNVLK